MATAKKTDSLAVVAQTMASSSLPVPTPAVVEIPVNNVIEESNTKSVFEVDEKSRDCDDTLRNSVDNLAVEQPIWPRESEDEAGFFSVFKVSDNPTTNFGKKMQLIRMLGIAIVPITILLSLVGTIFCIRLNDWLRSTEVRQTLRFSIEISELVDNLQKERDYSAIYVSSLRMATKAYLVERYPLTDAAIQSLTDWDASDNNDLHYFQSKENFQNYLNRHRYELDSIKPTEKDELLFYSELIGIFMQWFYDTMTEASSGTVWKQLVSLQETMEAKEMFGIERAFGSIYYIQGGFSDRGDYLIFAESQDVANATLKAAREYSSDVEGVYQETITEEEERVFEEVIRDYRYEIRNNPFPPNMTGSLTLAKYWSDNMTLYVDAILAIQVVLTERIYNDLLKTEQGDKLILTTLGLVVAFTIGMYPIILKTVYSLTLNIQNYYACLLESTKALNIERQRTDTLQYQMLPASLAKQVKMGHTIQADVYQEASIMFTSVVRFTSISARSSPNQVVAMLHTLNTIFDEEIQKHDVYKIETTDVTNTVISGVPERNGKRHAYEIAHMALALQTQVHNLEVPHMPGTKIKLRLGVHTGMVIAGAIGSQMPQFSLFGDIVSSAEILERTGKGGCIHVSAAGRAGIIESGEPFVMTRREWDVMHDAELLQETYWLLPHRSTESNITISTDNDAYHSEEEDFEDDDLLTPDDYSTFLLADTYKKEG